MLLEMVIIDCCLVVMFLFNGGFVISPDMLKAKRQIPL